MRKLLVAAWAAVVAFTTIPLPAHAEPVHVSLASSVSSTQAFGGLASVSIINDRAETVPAYVLLMDPDDELAAAYTLDANQPAAVFDTMPTTYRLIVALAEPGRETIDVRLEVEANAAVTLTID